MPDEVRDPLEWLGLLQELRDQAYRMIPEGKYTADYPKLGEVIGLVTDLIEALSEKWWRQRWPA